MRYKKCVVCGITFSSARKNNNRSLGIKQFKKTKCCSRVCAGINRHKKIKATSNRYYSKGKISFVDTTTGIFTIDTKSISVLAEHIWHINKIGYVVTFVSRKILLLHRVVTKAPKGMVVDHINGIKSDNRMENLRVCLFQENIRNAKLNKNSTTGFKGVYFQNGKYTAQIKFKYQHYYLGRFLTAKEAGDAYNKKANELFGEFARLN